MKKLTYENITKISDHIHTNWEKIKKEKPTQKQYAEYIKDEFEIMCDNNTISRAARCKGHKWPYKRYTKASVIKKYLAENREIILEGDIRQIDIVEKIKDECSIDVNVALIGQHWANMYNEIWPSKYNKVNPDRYVQELENNKNTENRLADLTESVDNLTRKIDLLLEELT